MAFGGCCLAAAGGSARAADTWTTPYPGVRHLHRTGAGPINVRAAVVDLCEPGVSLRATKPSERSRVTSSFGAAAGVELAVNGDYFTGSSRTPVGLAIGAGERWSGTADTAGHGFVAFGAGRAQIPVVGDVVEPPPAWMREVVGGNAILVLGGMAGSGFTGSLCTDRHPRTAVGLSANRAQLQVAVVDGRSSSSRGMTCTELAALMRDLGAEIALMLDGGGSSTMWMRGAGVVNRPSDGSERVVANHLGIFAKGAVGGVSSCSNQPPKGYLDRATCTSVAGWAQDPDDPGRAIDVQISVDAPPGMPGATTVTVPANIRRMDLCSVLGSCDHGFDAALPAKLWDGADHPVWAYGVDVTGGPPALLMGSPKTMSCAPPDGGAGPEAGDAAVDGDAADTVDARAAAGDLPAPIGDARSDGNGNGDGRTHGAETQPSIEPGAAAYDGSAPSDAPAPSGEGGSGGTGCGCAASGGVARLSWRWLLPVLAALLLAAAAPARRRARRRNPLFTGADPSSYRSRA